MCHETCCLAYFCQMCAIGQLLHRTQLSWFGEPTDEKPLKTYYIWFVIAIACLVIHRILDCILYAKIMLIDLETFDAADPTPEVESYTIASSVCSMISLGITAFTVFMIMKLRQRVRARHGIEQSCGLEDCCVSFWCPSCVLCQIDRHTAVYEAKQKANCFSTTGIDSIVLEYETA